MQPRAFWIFLGILTTCPLYAGGSTGISVESLGDQGFLINQPSTGVQFGERVSGAGDFNGDGYADVIVGDYFGEGSPLLLLDDGAGEAYVVFGGPETGDVILDNPAGRGITILGNSNDGRLGVAVSGAGDFNGDGFDDVIIGASQNNNGAGEAFVVFGSANPSDLDLTQPGFGAPRRVRIDGASIDDNLGAAVSGAGDVNGDGLADVIVGAPFADPFGVSGAGRAYVIFGRTSADPIDVGALNGTGFILNGGDSFGFAGASISGAGDFNGDGLADVVIGARRVDQPGGTMAGEAYLVYGKKTTASRSLHLLNGQAGFLMRGIDMDDTAGTSVAGAGDVNGDGYADVIIGAPEAANAAGEAYVVYGAPTNSNLDLASLGSRGFLIEGGGSSRAGFAVAGAGDLDGDGFSSILVGAPFQEVDMNVNSGAIFALFGSDMMADTDLGISPVDGLVIEGAPFERYGWRVSAAGDVDGNGRGDVIVGSQGAGQVAVVFNPVSARRNGSYRTFIENGNAGKVAVGVVGDGSMASSPDSAAWLDFADGNDPVDDASLVTVERRDSAGTFSASVADVSWLISSPRTFTSAEVTVRYQEDTLAVDEDLLGLFFSPDGFPPYTLVSGSAVDTSRNTVSGVTSQLGVFYLGDADGLFADGFESPPIGPVAR